MSRAAALELQRWFAPLGYRKKSLSGLRLVRRLKTGNRRRWGFQVSAKAIQRWMPVFRALQLWNPIPLYQKLKAQRYDLRLFARLRKFTWHIFAPKRSQKKKYGPKYAGMDIKLRSVKRLHHQRRRPYRLTFSSYAPSLPLRISQLDAVVKALILRWTQPRLKIALAAGQPRLFPNLRGRRSRQVARWLLSRFPQSSKVIDRYIDLRKILEPMGNGYYKLDLRWRWKGRASRVKPKASKNRFRFSLTFRDRAKGRRWLRWSFDQNSREHRIRGVLYRGGFAMCDEQWRPQSGPWRPTTLGSRWISHIRTSLRSPNVQVRVSHIMFGWKVRALKRGASLSMGLIHRPMFQIKGLSSVRSLTRLLIPGGIEKMVRQFLYNMAHGDRNKGLRWRWDFVEHPRRSRIHFRFVLPMVPDRKLTSLLRLVPQAATRPGRRSRRPRPRRSQRPRRSPRSQSPIRRRRRAGPSFWKRLHTAFFADLKAAQDRISRP